MALLMSVHLPSLCLSTAPSTVPIMHQVSATMRSITLSWPQPEQPNGIILDYEIRYYEKVSQLCLQFARPRASHWSIGGEPLTAKHIGWRKSWGRRESGSRDHRLPGRVPPVFLGKASKAQALDVPTWERIFYVLPCYLISLLGWYGQGPSHSPSYVFAVLMQRLQNSRSPLNFLEILWFFRPVFFSFWLCTSIIILFINHMQV